MKHTMLIFGACAAFALTAHSQTTAEAGASGAAGAAGASAGGVNGQAGAAAGQNSGANTTVSGPGAVRPNGNGVPGASGRDQVPPGAQNREQLPINAANGVTNSLGAGLGGPATNQLALTNQFGWRSNRFGLTNEFGGRSNRFGTNDFAWRSNRFDRSNEFGWRSNRFDRTNGIGAWTNRFRGTNEIATSNSVDVSVSNEITFGTNGTGFPVGGGVGIVPGTVGVGGVGAVTPAPPIQPDGTPVPTGNATDRVYPGGASPTNRAGVTLQDRAVTERDRSVLVKVRQLVVPRLEAMGAWAPAVHFWVRDGLVTMIGAVQSAQIKQEAEQVALQTPGVTRVENQLFVGNVDPNANAVDQSLLFQIRQRVLPQLQQTGSTPPVDFAVRDGVVTIVGKLSTPEEQAQVAKLVQQVPGVAQVRSQALISTDVNGGVTPNSSVTGSDEIAAPVAGGTNSNLTPTGRANNENAPPPQETAPKPINPPSTPDGAQDTQPKP